MSTRTSFLMKIILIGWHDQLTDIYSFHKRIYFFSESKRQIYRYLPMFGGASEPLRAYKSGKSLKFNILTDEDKHDSIYVSDRLITRTSTMTKIELKWIRWRWRVNDVYFWFHIDLFVNDPTITSDVNDPTMTWWDQKDDRGRTCIRYKRWTY